MNVRATVPAAALGLVVACATPQQTPQQTREAGPAEPGAWRTLFDGQTTAEWRAFRGEGIPQGWQIVDGALTRVGRAGDIVTVAQFGSFELTLEWQVAAGGNSGVMYHVTEEADETYKTGPELQILDDAQHPDGAARLTAAGACYGLYPSPPGAVRPAGEWNTVRLLVDGPHVEHWLNGVKVAEYELWSADWDARVKASKFAEWPGFGLARRGHIALQDHGDRVAFRNIKIRVLS